VTENTPQGSGCMGFAKFVPLFNRRLCAMAEFGEPSASEGQPELACPRLRQTAHAQAEQAQWPIHQALPR